MKTRSAALIIVLVVMLPLAACSSAIRKPQLLHPGPAGFQRNNAEQFDPFPSNDMGPEIVGGRPRGFLKPPNEVTRARQNNPIAPWRTTAPGPTPIPVLPPVIPAQTAPLY